MKIKIVWGMSNGPTKKSAFDHALSIAGIHNLNLIELSSVIPPRTEIIEVGSVDQISIGSIGKVVLSHIEGKNCWIASGLGWVVAKEGGIFVESAMEGRSSDCEKEIIQGIKSMMDYRKWNWIMAPKIKTVEIKAVDNFFSSVVVAAIYKIELLK